MMHKLDGFISSGGFAEESEEDVSPLHNADAVVYIGSNMIPPAWSFKEHENVKIIFITEVGEICNESGFKYLFAFSEKDFENLMISSMAKKRDGEIYVGAVCNDPKNKKLFDMNNINILLPEQFTFEGILSLINSDKNRRVKLV